MLTAYGTLLASDLKVYIRGKLGHSANQQIDCCGRCLIPNRCPWLLCIWCLFTCGIALCCAAVIAYLSVRIGPATPKRDAKISKTESYFKKINPSWEKKGIRWEFRFTEQESSKKRRTRKTNRRIFVSFVE